MTKASDATMNMNTNVNVNMNVNTHTDTSVATDKVTTATTDSSTTSMKPVRSDDEKSLEGAFATEMPVIPDFTPPLRINATRVPERLSGSSSALQIPASLQSQLRRRKSDPAISSRSSGSRSPATGQHNFDGGSSISSLEEIIDPDILTDKMGFLELDPKEQQNSSRTLNNSCSNLTAVNERMSEDTLDDCHAFSDLKREGNVSRGNSITTGGEVSSTMLEPLDECEDEDIEEEGQVILTNMEKIKEVEEEDAAEHSPASLVST
jgi:hypothetical protein